VHVGLHKPRFCLVDSCRRLCRVASWLTTRSCSIRGLNLVGLESRDVLRQKTTTSDIPKRTQDLPVTRLVTQIRGFIRFPCHSRRTVIPKMAHELITRARSNHNKSWLTFNSPVSIATSRCGKNNQPHSSVHHPFIQYASCSNLITKSYTLCNVGAAALVYANIII